MNGFVLLAHTLINTMRAHNILLILSTLTLKTNITLTDLIHGVRIRRNEVHSNSVSPSYDHKLHLALAMDPAETKIERKQIKGKGSRPK